MSSPARSEFARVGCAGWAIPRAYADAFPAAGSHLERYAKRLPAVEINSSFYRPHRTSTYARWAASVPESFRFSVKMPKEITHRRRLRDAEAPLERVLGEAGALGDRLGPLLVQLPPMLPFDVRKVGAFLASLRQRFAGAVVCEPRHASWFDGEADRLLCEFQIARVAADPPPAPGAELPGGWHGLVYYRLHGAPRMYYSAYAAADLDVLAGTLAAASADGTPVWCIFDNTALGAATADALGLLARLRERSPRTISPA